MKKILLLVALIVCVFAVTPAVAYESDIEGDGYFQYADVGWAFQGYLQGTIIGIEVGPIEMSEYEKYCHYQWGESFYWGGLSIDFIAFQGAVQTMHLTGGNGGLLQCQESNFYFSDGKVTLSMTGNQFQTGWSNSRQHKFGGIPD